MGGKHLKKVHGTTGKQIKQSSDTSPNIDIKHPVFCFKHLNKKYNLEKCQPREKVSLIDRISRLCTMTWEQVQMAPKEGFGTEKISQNAITGAAIPNHLTKDEIFYALRFDGKKPMVGYKTAFVFHVVYLDRDFTLYNHG